MQKNVKKNFQKLCQKVKKHSSKEIVIFLQQADVLILSLFKAINRQKTERNLIAKSYNSLLSSF